MRPTRSVGRGRIASARFTPPGPSGDSSNERTPSGPHGPMQSRSSRSGRLHRRGTAWPGRQTEVPAPEPPLRFIAHRTSLTLLLPSLPFVKVAEIASATLRKYRTFTKQLRQVRGGPRLHHARPVHVCVTSMCFYARWHLGRTGQRKGAGHAARVSSGSA